MRNDGLPGAEFLYTVRGRGAGNFTGEALGRCVGTRLKMSQQILATLHQQALIIVYTLNERRITGQSSS
jgi:hypothetical protein